jgi:hypothetical protein
MTDAKSMTSDGDPADLGMPPPTRTIKIALYLL